VVRRYEIRSHKVKRDTRFVLLADLHNKDYGDHNRRVLDAIEAEHPDAILVAGDILDGLAGHSFETAVRLITDLAKDYPVYYGLGNHEYRLKIYREEYGTMWEEYLPRISVDNVHILDNERMTIPDAGIDIAGVSLEKYYYKRIAQTVMTDEVIDGYVGKASEEAFQILIAHNPEYFKNYTAWGADLTVSGHIHGGIIRLPFIGGLIAPRLFSFPRYSGGEYDDNGRKMIVSCGMGTHTIHVRVFNPAELGVIDIKRETD
jgi:predicted MPP superfamily phosphohydrolase